MEEREGEAFSREGTEARRDRAAVASGSEQLLDPLQFLREFEAKLCISAFGKDAKAALSNAAITGQPEDQLRTPLLNLFKDFAQLTDKAGMVTLVGETSLAGMQTRPDFAVTTGTGQAQALVGFIEVKAPGKGANPNKFKDAHDKAQWAKLKALPNLLYTDGNGFWRGRTVSLPVTSRWRETLRQPALH